MLCAVMAEHARTREKFCEKTWCIRIFSDSVFSFSHHFNALWGSLSNEDADAEDDGKEQ